MHVRRYEDMAEFEDALHGTFEQFIVQFPHIETKTDEKGRMVRDLASAMRQSGLQGGGSFLCSFLCAQ